MKHLKKTLFILSMTVVLASCSTGGKPFDWNDVKNNGTGISLESPKVAKCDLNFNNDAFKNAMTKADEIAVNKGSVYSFLGEMNKVTDYMSSLREKLTVARGKYQATADEEANKKYDELNEYYLSFYTWYYTFLEHVKGSSKEIYNAFFEGMSEKEVDEYINNFLYTEETKKLDTEITAIEDEQEEAYNQFILDYRNQSIRYNDSGWNKYLKDSLTRFREVIAKGNRIASIYGFDNYLDYVYKYYYSRNYKYDFVDEYTKLIDQYVVPMTMYYENGVDSSVVKKGTNKKIFDAFTSGNIANETYFQGDLLDSYVDMMGGDMLKAYNHLKKDGYYIFSNDKNSLGTAYVSSGMDDPLIFFSKDYQNISTIVHEFGHYNAAYNNENNGSFPFDIEETHSQGNEMLFNRYLSDYYKDSENLKVYQYIQDYEVYEMLSNAILPTAVATVESYIFENLDKTDDAILTGVNSIMARYRALYGDGYDMVMAYWAAPVVSATGYYISYSTSAVGAVAIYIQAKEDYQKAIANYKKFVAYPEECQDVDTFFTYSGLYSPMQESTFQKFTHENLYSF